MDRLSIYCARPMTGCNFEDVKTYYNYIQLLLKQMGYNVFTPMACKEGIKIDKFQSQGYKHPIINDHAIVERDRWMVKRADIILTDFSAATQISIGCISELAWAHDNGKHTIVVMNKENVHRHSFTIEMADIIFETLLEANTYLQSLIEMRI